MYTRCSRSEFSQQPDDVLALFTAELIYLDEFLGRSQQHRRFQDASMKCSVGNTKGLRPQHAIVDHSASLVVELFDWEG